MALDDLRWRYYPEVGWNEAEQRRASEAEGFGGVYRYWKRLDLHAVRRVLEEHPESVIHFGAGHSVYEDGEELARAWALLEPYANVVLLLPSPDLDESVAVLRERGRWEIGGVDINRYLASHPSVHDLADHTVYTEGRAPEETADEILRLLAGEGSPAARGCSDDLRG